MLAQPLDIGGNPKDEQFSVVWVPMDKSSPNYILLMNSRPFQMSKPIFVGFSITLVGLINYSRIYSVKDGIQFHQQPVIYPCCINVESVCHVGPAG